MLTEKKNTKACDSVRQQNDLLSFLTSVSLGPPCGLTIKLHLHLEY